MSEAAQNNGFSPAVAQRLRAPTSVGPFTGAAHGGRSRGLLTGTGCGGLPSSLAPAQLDLLDLMVSMLHPPKRAAAAPRRSSPFADQIRGATLHRAVMTVLLGPLALLCSPAWSIPHAASPAIALVDEEAGEASDQQVEGASAEDAQDAVAPPREDPATEPPPTAPAKPRVHLIIDRRTEVGGFLERETDNDLVILWKGETLTFPKSRVLRVVRLVDPKPGQRGALLLRDGSVLEGVILHDGFDEVVLEVAGIRTRYPRKEVDSVRLEPSFEERYTEFQRSIRRNDWPRRMELARWLFDNRRYELARDELLPIVELSDEEGASELLRLVEAQLRLQRATGGESRSLAPDPEPWERERPRASGRVELRDILPQRILTREDVNIIRVYEMDLRNPPRLAVSDKTIRTMLENYGSSELLPADSAGRTALFRQDPLELTKLLFKLKARELYPQIDVLSEPAHLNLFRQRVHNAWLIPNCATSRCHGGADAGHFFLHSRNYKDERVRYTNLLILERSSFDGRPMLDFDDPLSSLVIQYGLPRNEARFPHPDVKGWRPVFQDANKRLLKDAVDWIRAMYLPRPDYPIDYEPPKLMSPTRTDPPDPEERQDR